MGYRKDYVILNPYEIGGRSTDVAQIAYSITSLVKDVFPINEVPSEYAAQLEHLTRLLEVAQTEIERTVEMLKRA